MLNARTRMLMVIWTLSFVLVALILFLNHRSSRSKETTPPPAALEELKSRQTKANFHSPEATPVVEPAESPDEEQSGLPKLPREKVEEYLTRHNRDAASLLAAFRELGDTNYLNEAATKFPTNAQVQWTILARDAFPEDRRKWLDAFKASSPDNSLANYLSAQNYFKINQPDVAIKELLEASGKSKFSDFAMESYLGAEELSRFGGRSPLMASTAAMSAMSGELLPELANMKGITQGVLDVQKQYLSSGDAASVQNLSEMGVGLANRLTTGDGGRFLISQLVGMATESIALKSLDQSTPYDFLGGKTPAQRMDELKEQKSMFRELSKGMGLNFVMLPEAEQSSYLDRVKIYGEVEALRWMQQQYGTNTP